MGEYLVVSVTEFYFDHLEPGAPFHDLCGTVADVMQQIEENEEVALKGNVVKKILENRREAKA